MVRAPPSIWRRPQSNHVTGTMCRRARSCASILTAPATCACCVRHSWTISATSIVCLTTRFSLPPPSDCAAARGASTRTVRLLLCQMAPLRARLSRHCDRQRQARRRRRPSPQALRQPCRNGLSPPTRPPLPACSSRQPEAARRSVKFAPRRPPLTPHERRHPSVAHRYTVARRRYRRRQPGLLAAGRRARPAHCPPCTLGQSRILLPVQRHARPCVVDSSALAGASRGELTDGATPVDAGLGPLLGDFYDSAGPRNAGASACT